MCLSVNLVAVVLMISSIPFVSASGFEGESQPGLGTESVNPNEILSPRIRSKGGLGNEQTADNALDTDDISSGEETVITTSNTRKTNRGPSPDMIPAFLNENSVHPKDERYAPVLVQPIEDTDSSLQNGGTEEEWITPASQCPLADFLTSDASQEYESHMIREATAECRNEDPVLNEGESGVDAKNRTGLGGSRQSDNTEQLGEFAVTNDNVVDVLLTVDGLANVRDTGNPSDVNKLVITRLGSLVEITLWYHNYVNTWLLQSSSTQEITIPLDKAFTVTVYHYDKIGWLFCRHRTEDSKYILSCNTLQGGSHASTGDPTIETLIDVSGLGKITDSTTDGHKLILTSYGSGVEWSYWDGDPSYNQDYIPPYSQTTIDFDHYRSFIVTIYRSTMIGWMFCRENANSLKCSTKQGGLSAYTGDTTEETLVNVPGLGKVTDSGVAQQPRVPQQVKIYSYTGATLVYSIWYYNSYISGTISYPGWYTTVQVPWYKSFTMSIQSPSFKDARITWLFCRVNDRRLTCHTLSITTQKMNKLDWNGLDSNANTSDKTMDIDEAIFTDADDKVTAKWYAPSTFFEVTVHVYCRDEGPSQNGALKFYFDGNYWSTQDCSSGFDYLSFRYYWFDPQDAGYHTIQLRESHDNSIVRLTEGDADPGYPVIDAVIYVESPGFTKEYYEMHEVEWRNIDSDDTSPHLEIGNYALFWHEGDDVRWNSIQTSPDFVKIGVYCKSYTTSARLKLYISSTSKGTYTITQTTWDWFYFDRWDYVSGSFSIRLKHKEGGPYPPDSDIGITDLRLIF